MYHCDGNNTMKVFDGDFTTGTVKNYCGYNTPEPFFATGNKVALRTMKDSVGSYDITYLATDKGIGCGGTLYNYFGAFTSPLYPNPDRSTSECRWNIVVPSNLKVSLKFDIFDMGSRQYCSTNYVVLYDITQESEKEVSRFCGGDTPAQIVSKSSTMAVVFKKTVNFSGSGFKVTFMGVYESKW